MTNYFSKLTTLKCVSSELMLSGPKNFQTVTVLQFFGRERKASSWNYCKGYPHIQQAKQRAAACACP